MAPIWTFISNFFVLSITTSEALGVTKQHGRTRLLGSSFGVPTLNATFDYIVVGGGTAGLTTASRLAEDGRFSVAVVEGGSFYEIDNGNYSQIPAYDVMFSTPDPSSIQPLVDWGIVTAPQPLWSQLPRIPTDLSGTKGSYQQWADQVGDQSWTFDNLLPYFHKSPHFTPPNYRKRGPNSAVTFDVDAFSPSGGPLQVSYSNYYQPFSPYIKLALQKLGLEEIAGLLSGTLLGFSEFTITADPRTATRSSSETSFLQDAIAYTAIQIYQRTTAKRILFDGNKVATSVIVETAGAQYKLSATKEIIVSAGVFRSPQLLMVSGIGPSSTLRDLDIPIVSALEGVGQGMQDQPYFGTTYKVNVTTNSQLSVNPSFLAKATNDFLETQTGPLNPAGNWIEKYLGWEKLPPSLRTTLTPPTLSLLSTFPPDWPELELIPLPSATGPVPDADNYAAISIATLTATSRGNVTIASADSNDNPIVSPNWLLTTTDQELAVAGFKRARQFAAATGIVVGGEVVPGEGVESDGEILEYVRGTLGPIHHAACTCAMGKPDDPQAVVDSRGKVYGVKRLRVADISVFPLLPPGHPQASVYMLAEKIADDILSGG
ncbi:MAG: hypothetical protein Q9220_004330 [cf. Caloplaca sp. 1 TL-2023]